MNKKKLILIAMQVLKSEIKKRIVHIDEKGRETCYDVVEPEKSEETKIAEPVPYLTIQSVLPVLQKPKLKKLKKLKQAPLKISALQKARQKVNDLKKMIQAESENLYRLQMEYNNQTEKDKTAEEKNIIKEKFNNETQKLLERVRVLEKKLKKYQNTVHLLENEQNNKIEEESAQQPFEKKPLAINTLLARKLGRKLNQEENEQLDKADKDFNYQLELTEGTIIKTLCPIKYENVQKEIEKAKNILKTQSEQKDLSPDAIQKQLIKNLEKQKIKTLALNCAYILLSKDQEIENLLSEKDNATLKQYKEKQKNKTTKNEDNSLPAFFTIDEKNLIFTTQKKLSLKDFLEARLGRELKRHEMHMLKKALSNNYIKFNPLLITKQSLQKEIEKAKKELTQNKAEKNLSSSKIQKQIGNNITKMQTKMMTITCAHMLAKEVKDL